MGMYDIILVDGRGDEGGGQVKLWHNRMDEYRLGDKVPPGPGGVNTYSIAMREGGFVNIAGCILVCWTDSAEREPVYDKWGDIFQVPAEGYLFDRGES